jgi:D-amino-acid dehydrogenase
MSGQHGKVIVVGAGLIGAASAWFLQRAGWQVTMLDQGRFGRGASHANCGFVCPSHVLPLAGPGAVRSSLKALLQPNGPLKIRARWDPALWNWLFRFARRCNRKDMLQAGHALQPLLQSSRQLYEELIKTERLDCEWEARGMLFVLKTPAAMEHYAETDKLLSQEFNLPARRIEGAELTALEPALRPGLAGGWFYETDAHLRPDRLMAEWRRILEARGVVVQEDSPVVGFKQSQGKVVAAVTPKGEQAADAFVLATGAWSRPLGRQLGCFLPIEPGKGYSMTMPRPARCPTYPLIFEEHRVAVTPMRSGYRLGSTMEFAGFDSTLRRERLELLKQGAALYLHEPCAEPIVEEWFGWRPMTPDSLPIIDRCPRAGNLVIAAGHNMIGLASATATGKLVMELLCNQSPHLEIRPFRATRF